MRSVRLIAVVALPATACSCFYHKDKCSYDICDVISRPEKIEVIEVPEAYRNREESTLKLLSGFPFISYKPVIDFYGKFPPEFYSAIKVRWRAAPFEKANYWRMRWDPYVYDFIYTRPLWIGNFSLKYEDFLKNLAVSFNVSDEETEILKNWIKQGGVLWIESAIFVSTYDMELRKIGINDIIKFARRLEKCKLFGRKLKVFILKAKRIDKFHTKTLIKEVTVNETSGLSEVLSGVKRLLLTQEDYIGIYFTVDGVPIVKDGRRVYSSYVTYGKGKIITTVPFDFSNVHYDGELYRWNLLRWAVKRK